jgi:large subunit ribosomal protein L23
VKDPRDIIFRPVISEKSYGLLDQNKYTFIVDKRANKTQIKQAIEGIFDVTVLKRRGLIVGKRPDTKRAIVTLAEGDEIALFDAGL